MADLTIANLTAAGALTATDPVPVEQAGVAKRTTVKGIQEASVGATLAVTGLAVGDGSAPVTALITMNGGTDAGKGAGVSLKKGGTQFFAFYDEATITGSGTSNIPCLFAESGLGLKFLINGGLPNGMILTSGGNLGIKMTPTVEFELYGSVGQKASGTTWSNPSDERLKDIIGPADLQRCYDDVKSLKLKRYRVKDDCFTSEQARDRTVTGLVAGDVQKIIPKAVNVVPFTKVPIPDGVEEYQEQDFILEQIDVPEIKIINGVPTLGKVAKEQKRLLVDDIQVVDESGALVFQKNDKGEAKPLIHSVPRMVKKTRPKDRKEVIEDCLNLDMSQVYMQMFGAVQLLIQKVEALEAAVLKP